MTVRVNAENDGKWPLTLGGIVAFIALTVFIGLGLREQARYEDDGRSSTAHYAKHASEQIAHTCVDVPRAKHRACTEKARTEATLKAHDYEYSQADLVAQRTTAIWTAIMGGAALFGIALSFVGILLLWRTFSEARAANLIALGDREPSLHVEAISLAEDIVAGAVTVSTQIRNYGSGPAKDALTTCAVCFGPIPLPDNPPKFEDEAPGLKLPTGGTRTVMIEHKGLAEWREKILAGEAAVILACRMSYKDSYDREFKDEFYYISSGKRFEQGLMDDCRHWAGHNGGD